MNYKRKKSKRTIRRKEHNGEKSTAWSRMIHKWWLKSLEDRKPIGDGRLNYKALKELMRIEGLRTAEEAEKKKITP